MPAGLPLAFFAGALLALAVGVDHHAQAEDAVRDLRRVARRTSSTPGAPPGCSPPRRGSPSRRSGRRRRTRRRSPGRPTRRRRRPRWSCRSRSPGSSAPASEPAGRTNSTWPSSSCSAVPTFVQEPPSCDSRIASAPSSTGSNVAATTPGGLVAVRGVGPGLRDGRQDRDLDRGVGAAEELEVGERAGRDEHEDDDRDDQLGCSGQQVRPSLVATAWAGSSLHREGRRRGTRSRENPASLAQGPRVGSNPPEGPVGWSR